MRFRYTKHKDDVATDREVLPYDVYGQWGHWFVAGPEVGDEVVKRWRVDRMSARHGRRRVELRSARRAAEREDWFDLSETAADGDRAWCPRRGSPRSPSRSRSCRVRASATVGSALELEIAGDRHLDHLLVALGPDGEIVEPADLHDRRRARSAVLLAAYD